MKNHNIYKGTEKSNNINWSKRPKARSCGPCQGTGQVLSGRKRGSTCRSCGGSGNR